MDVDLIILARVTEGECSAFNLLTTKYYRKLYRLIKYIVRDPTDAEDLVQETFLKAYLGLSKFRGESSFYTWIYRIGINTARNFLDAKSRRSRVLVNAYRDSDEQFDYLDQLKDEATPDSVLASKQLARCVVSVINSMPTELQLVITLREVDGLSYDEIAEVMICPVGTVRSRLSRAREIIAEELQSHLI